MNVERLHAIAKGIRADLSSTSAVSVTRQLRDHLRNLVSAPQDATHQQGVSDTLQRLRGALSGAASNDFPPLWLQVLEELRVEGLLGNALLTRVEATFSHNQLTPSIALEEIEVIVASLEQLESAVEQLLAALSSFDVGSEELEPGEAEVAVLIPRLAVGDELERLGKEFIELEKILGPFLEVATGSRPPLEVTSVSSSDFGVFVDMAPSAAMFVAIAVERVLAGYKQVLEIRTLRQGLSEQGLNDQDLAGVDAHANIRMDAVNTETAQDLVSRAVDTDPGRRNELAIEIRFSLNALANRIDKGYNIDVRANASEASEEDESTEESEREALRQIQYLSPRLRFINRTGSPVLQLPENGQQGDDVLDPPIDH